MLASSGECGIRRSVRFLEGFQTGGSSCHPRYGWRGMSRHWKCRSLIPSNSAASTQHTTQPPRHTPLRRLRDRYEAEGAEDLIGRRRGRQAPVVRSNSWWSNTAPADPGGLGTGRVQHRGIIASYSPEARCRIERVFGMLQQRLPPLLRLNVISTIEPGNRYSTETYLRTTQRALCRDCGRARQRLRAVRGEPHERARDRSRHLVFCPRAPVHDGTSVEQNAWS